MKKLLTSAMLLLLPVSAMAIPLETVKWEDKWDTGTTLYKDSSYRIGFDLKDDGFDPAYMLANYYTIKFDFIGTGKDGHISQHTVKVSQPGEETYLQPGRKGAESLIHWNWDYGVDEVKSSKEGLETLNTKGLLGIRVELKKGWELALRGATLLAEGLIKKPIYEGGKEVTPVPAPAGVAFLAFALTGMMIRRRQQAS